MAEALMRDLCQEFEENLWYSKSGFCFLGLL